MFRTPSPRPNKISEFSRVLVCYDTNYSTKHISVKHVFFFLFEEEEEFTNSYTARSTYAVGFPKRFSKTLVSFIKH